MSTPVPSTPVSFSAATIARFDREVAKYPAEQRISAVMACLAIIQQEQGWVSPEAEAALAAERAQQERAQEERTRESDGSQQQQSNRDSLS